MVRQPRLSGVERATTEGCPCTGAASYYTVEMEEVECPPTNKTEPGP